MEVKDNELIWAKIRPDAKIPTKKDEDAGYDFYPCFEGGGMEFAPSETRLVPTGVACAMASDYYLQIEERGSTGSKGIKKSAGIIDSGYRGEIFVPITNSTNRWVLILKDDIVRSRKEKGIIKEDKYGTSTKFTVDGVDITIDCIIYPYEKAIAQGIIHRVHKMDEKEVTYEELLTIPSTRGTGMLGSSGK